jgi:hypothetical protein
MTVHSAKVGSVLIKAECDAACDDQAEWLMGLLRRINEQRGGSFLKNGVRVQLGWTTLTLMQHGDALWVCEPDFQGDPTRETRRDITTSLRVQYLQNTIAKKVGVEGVPAAFHEKVVLSAGCLRENKVYLQRSQPKQGDSGWYVGPVNESSSGGALEAIYVFNLLALRPALLEVLSLPPGYMAVFSGEKIEAILNEKDERVYSGIHRN